jgi:hypothetical protein
MGGGSIKKIKIFYIIKQKISALSCGDSKEKTDPKKWDQTVTDLIDLCTTLTL